MGKLTVVTQVPGPQAEVYKKVTAYEPEKTMQEPDAEKKYGRLIEQTDGVYLFQETEAEHALQWRITFDPPTQRFMEAVDIRWADRLDHFKPTATGTEWTIVWHTKARGVLGLLQSVVFSINGRKRVQRDIVQPVLAEFRG